MRMGGRVIFFFSLVEEVGNGESICQRCNSRPKEILQMSKGSKRDPLNCV